MKKRISAILLALVMALALLPVTAFADGEVAKITDGTTTTQYATLDDAVVAAKDGDIIDLLADCTTNGFALDKNLTINGHEKTITFDGKGIALRGKGLTFNGCNVVMTGIGSTPYGGWDWMTICASKDASLTLENTTMTMDGAGTGSDNSKKTHAIYFCENNKLNMKRSTLTIKNYAHDALEWNGGDGGYNVNLTDDSYFLSDHNRSGFTGTFTVTCDKSKIDVINSTGNGSNGSNFDIKNGSVVNFNNNGTHGLSAVWCNIDNSTVTTNGNGANGLHTGSTLTINNRSTVTVKNNQCAISSQWTIPGAVHIGGGESSITNSTVTIQGNSGSGIYQKAGTLTVNELSEVTIVENTAVKLGYGGGIYVNGTVDFPENVVLYNNHAGTAGDDIYNNNGTISFGNTGVGWKLDGAPDCNGEIHAIDGWYEDGEGSRWLADTDVDKQHIVEKEAGKYEGLVALKAAHGVLPPPVEDEMPSHEHEHTRRQPTTVTETAPKTEDVTSAKTFDAGIAVYAAMAVLSMTGSAWIVGKRH